ncbi:MAG: acetate--CoA ligase [Gammaproteobacteria bacterium]|nr:acetate--CoA ligase [Gammaproteobacteria bacterium]MYF68022.1 acetate--CoA ligase [Gammaproteobacteria bacterium]MYK37696.1 acetate--CoA ligase [Gammaproteobacteria bacterium]
MSTGNIESVLSEDRRFDPDESFANRAQVNGELLDELCRRGDSDPVSLWADLAREMLTWHKPFSATLDRSRAPHFAWFSDGELNASEACLGPWIRQVPDRPAIVYEGEDGDSRTLTYRELGGAVERLGAALRGQGVAAGDRVVIYMPMCPEAIVAMHACARIGAVHSVVFGGFSARSLYDRVVDASAEVVITADAGRRGGKFVRLKAAVDRALEYGEHPVRRVIVFRHSGEDVAWNDSRDRWAHELTDSAAADCPAEYVNAEHPLFLLYTSGSTGKPKGIQHSTAGYLLHARLTCRWVFDLREDDVFWCTADVGWITGHSYVAYGPLASGATVVIYEGAPTWPHGGRFWEICERYGVTVFYTAPTAIRALMKLGDELPGKYDLSSLRLLGTVGEPINPEAWMWYHRVIGNGGCPIVDTWWQTETGGIMISPVPGVTSTKPGSCTRPLPGVHAAIVDENGDEITEPDRGGYLVIRHPWPSMLRNIWGDSERYRETYFGKFGDDCYITGDSARRDADGYFWIMGRLDDVVNVSGHRLGTMEVESALVAHPSVAEAAVVSRPHEIKGESIFAFVVLKSVSEGTSPSPGREGVAPSNQNTMEQQLRAWVDEQLGPIARPDDLRIVEALPKTRSGKIMRRLLRSIARGEEINQDVSTLENADLVRQLMRP